MHSAVGSSCCTTSTQPCISVSRCHVHQQTPVQQHSTVLRSHKVTLYKRLLCCRSLVSTAVRTAVLPCHPRQCTQLLCCLQFTANAIHDTGARHGSYAADAIAATVASIVRQQESPSSSTTATSSRLTRAIAAAAGSESNRPVICSADNSLPQ